MNTLASPAHPARVASLLALLSLVAAGPVRAADFNVAEARRGVVFIRCMTPGLGTGEGSGFLVTDDGLIYTNRHVVRPDDGPGAGTVILAGVPSRKDPDVLDYFKAEVVFVTKPDTPLDFAILKIAARDGYGPFKTVPVADGALELGSAVAAIGYPNVDSEHPALSLNKGSISVARRQIGGVAYCQTDAAVNPGNSGGPLLGPSGAAVGIVTAKKLDAENIGFALYLSAVKDVARAATTADKMRSVRPEAGPLDPAKLPRPDGIKPTAANWDVGAGRIVQAKGALLVDNAGAEYWLVSKRDLPEDFQLHVTCAVGFLQGRYHIQPSQRNVLRTMVVRFGSDDTKSDVLARKGYMLQFSNAGVWLYKENGDESGKCVANAWTGNTTDPMILTVTKNGGDLTVAANRHKLLEYHDPDPIAGKHPFCVGGFLSQMALGEVQITALGDRGQTPAPATVPTTAPTTSPTTAPIAP